MLVGCQTLQQACRCDPHAWHRMALSHQSSAASGRLWAKGDQAGLGLPAWMGSTKTYNRPILKAASWASGPHLRATGAPGMDQRECCHHVLGAVIRPA